MSAITGKLITAEEFLHMPQPADGTRQVAALGANGQAQDVRIGISGAGPMPVRATASESALRGQQAISETIQRAAEICADTIGREGVWTEPVPGEAIRQPRDRK